MSVGASHLTWKAESDGTWIAETAALGNHGTQFVSEFGTLDNHVLMNSVHEVPEVSGGAPTPVWDHQELVTNSARQLVASPAGEFAASLHHEPMETHPGQQHTVLRKFSSTTGALIWTYPSPVAIPGHSFSDLHVSENGEVVVQHVYSTDTGKTRITVLDETYDPLTGVPATDVEVQTYGASRASDLSLDGSTLLIGSEMALTLIDVPSGAVVDQIFLTTTPQYGALAISADGETVAFGTYGRAILHTQNEADEYVHAHDIDLGGNEYASAVALSADGATLAVGAQSFVRPEDARLLVVDGDTGVVVWDRTFTGAGDYQNVVSQLCVSAGGERIAAGLWGDEGGLVPEVMVFERSSSEPTLSHHLSGSVHALDLSQAGFDLAVASKGTHANVLGGGGSLSCFKVGPVDLNVLGVPRVGSDVVIEHAVRFGGTGRVFIATELADVPVEAPALGEGLFFLDADQIVSELGPIEAAENHVARVTVPIQSGETLYVQAVNEYLGVLSNAWVPITPVP